MMGFLIFAAVAITLWSIIEWFFQGVEQILRGLFKLAGYILLAVFYILWFTFVVVPMALCLTVYCLVVWAAPPIGRLLWKAAKWKRSNEPWERRVAEVKEALDQDEELLTPMKIVE